MKREMRRSGEDERWREGRPMENYGKKEQNEWLDNTLPDPHPCTAGNKEEKHSDLRHWVSLTLSLRLETYMY